MPSGPITSWQIDGETVGRVSDFIFLGSKITMDGDCSHEIKRRLLLGRKIMTNLDSIFKSRDIVVPALGESVPYGAARAQGEAVPAADAPDAHAVELRARRGARPAARHEIDVVPPAGEPTEERVEVDF